MNSRAVYGGPPRSLVNNAAISPKGQRGERLAVLTSGMDVWRHVFEVNFFAIIALACGLIEELTAAKGAIVNVTSIAGSRVGQAPPSRGGRTLSASNVECPHPAEWEPAARRAFKRPAPDASAG